MRKIIILIGLALGITVSAGVAQNREVKIKSTDVISIRISGVPPDDAVDISQEYNVANDGKFPLPHIGRLTAAGLTPSELGIRVEEAYKAAGIFTKPNVVVTTPQLEVDVKNRTLKQVTISGEVRNPSRAPYTDRMTMLDALASAGGFTDWADKGRVRLIRNNQTTEHDMRKIGNDPTKDIPLQPDDKIIVIHR